MVQRIDQCAVYGAAVPHLCAVWGGAFPYGLLCADVYRGFAGVLCRYDEGGAAVLF